MRTRRVWGTAATLALGLAAPAVLAGYGDKPPKGYRLWDKPGAAKPDEAKDDKGAKEDTADAGGPAKARPAEREEDPAKAKADYLRRLQVVDRLVEIASRTNDAALEKKARELEERAQAVYLKKAPRLAGHSEAGPADGDAPAKGRTTAPRREKP